MALPKTLIIRRVFTKAELELITEIVSTCVGMSRPLAPPRRGLEG